MGHHALHPLQRQTCNYNPQPSIKIKNGIPVRRIRGTYGGNKSDYQGDVSAHTADLTTIKLLLNATISENAHFATVDIKDFYLGTELERPEYMRITRPQLPQDIIDRYQLEDLFHRGVNRRDDCVMVEIVKGIYGLPQAGRLAQEKLVKLLAANGYRSTANTPSLFKHDTRPVMFTLVVDDFAVKYHGEADEHLDHLLSVLNSVYTTTVDRTGSKYHGMDIKFDRVARTVSLSMPNYVRKALERFNVEVANHVTDSPLRYTPPSYGSGKQQYVKEDTSLPLSAEETKRIQQIVGVFLFYARAIDSTMLMPNNRFASQQSKPTEQLKRDVDRFLQYAATWPNAELVFKASDMRLYVESDASYLSEPNSRSRPGGIFYLGNNTPTKGYVNGAVECISTIIKAVVSSAFEAEYAALFLNGQTAQGIRNTLSDMGYPQGATPIVSDNACAVGIANQSVKQRRSKAIDMRYHWIRDRVEMGDFTVIWQRGESNLADYFTKAHPVHHYKAMRKIFVHTPPLLVPRNNANGRKQAARRTAAAARALMAVSRGVLESSGSSSWPV